MPTLNASSLQNQINSTLEDEDAENIIDSAINRISLYLKIKSLRNLTGTAGSKTLTCTQAEHGGIISVAVAIYSKEYVISGSQSQAFNLGALGTSQSSSQGTNSTVNDLAMQVAKQLEENEWSHAFI